MKLLTYTKSYVEKFLMIFTISFFVLILTATSTIPVYATPQDDLDNIQKQLDEINKEKNEINKTIKDESSIQDQLTRELTKLKNDINLLQNQIQETELTIQQLQVQITMLEEEILTTENDIAIAKAEIEKLQQETDGRLVEMYIEQKTYSQLNIIFSSEATGIVKMQSYQTSLQEETNKMLTSLNLKREELDKQKIKLEEDKVQVTRDEISVQEKKLGLEKNKTSIDSQRQIYYRKRNESLQRLDNKEKLADLLEEKEKFALAEQTRLIQIISDNIREIPNGAFVTKNTVIGYQGCTGLCTGPHLHFGTMTNGNYVNPCDVLGPNSACGGSGSLLFPMKGSYVLTSGYGWRWGKMHYGIDVANYSNSAPIYAAHNGYLQYGNDGICRNYKGSLPCNGNGGNYAIICENRNCNVGFKTMYWHLQ